MKILFSVLILASPVPALGLPDLTVAIAAPESAFAGSDVGKQVAITVVNQGNRTAPGSSNDGYMVDLFATRRDMPSGYARFDESYFDGVLLKGGRYSNTSDLPPGQRVELRSGATLPADMDAGRYRLCARVDPGDKVRESSETNNTACATIEITRATVFLPDRRFRALTLSDSNRDRELRLIEPMPPELRPEPVEPPRPAGQDAEMSVLEDGTIVMSYPDGSQRRLPPDGPIEYVSPDGLVMVPYAMQVEGDELPELPEPLVGWAEFLAADLLSIVGNILTDAELAAYRQTESDKNIYELIDWRLRSIRFLTQQETQ